MRVLVIIPDKYTYGGTSRFLERLLEIHKACGIETALLVPTHLDDDSLASLAAQHSAELFSAINKTRGNTSPFLTPLFDFFFSWRKVRSWCPDLVVVSTGDPGRMSVVFYFPIPALYILHTIPEKRFRYLSRLYLKLGLLINNMTMTVSTAAANSISTTMGIPLRKIAVVYNSCQQAQHQVKAGGPGVVTAGHLVSYKNPYGWLKVAQRVIQKRPDVIFTWLGDGELLAPMRVMVKTLGLEERVLLPGFVPDPAPWYETSQVYFQPSFRESQGIAVLEAMAHGLPCVVADTGGLPESVVDNETGFVCPSEDVNGFAGCILNLFDDPALRECMGTAGRVRVEKYFSEAEQERKIMELYDGLVTKTGKR